MTKKVLISLGELKSILQDGYKECCWRNGIPENATKNAIEWFDSQPEASQWISVEDALPDDGVLVFIFITELNIMTNFAWQLFKIGACYHKEDSRWGIMDYSQQGDFATVTHWMPIPPLGEDNG